MSSIRIRLPSVAVSKAAPFSEQILQRAKVKPGRHRSVRPLVFASSLHGSPRSTGAPRRRYQLINPSRCSPGVAQDSREEAKRAVQEAIESGTFMLEAAEVAALRAHLRMEEAAFLQFLIPPLKKLARPPTSNYYVGAVGLGASGRVYLGVNMEFRGMPLQFSVHAEQFMVANAKSKGEAALVKVAVSAAPCGHCRQFMTELPQFQAIEILVVGQSAVHLSDLLPHYFGPDDLLPPDSARLLDRTDHMLELAPEAVAQLEALDDPKIAATAAAALAAANDAYTPYSQSPAGMAVMTQCQNLYSGGALESCAYNPSMSPLQTALVATAADGGHAWEHLEHAVLVELQGGLVQHEATIELVLKQISPETTFTILQAIPRQDVQNN